MAALLCEACGDACSGLGQICDDFVRLVCPDDKPYPMFLCYTWILNLVPATAALILAFVGHEECTSPIEVFLIVSAIVSIAHMVFAVYIYNRVANPDPKYADYGIWAMATHLFLYDVGVLCYFCVWIFALVWTIYGGIWVARATCSGAITDMAAVMILLSYLQLFGGPCVVLMSICCDCCRDKRGFTKHDDGESGRRNSRTNLAPAARSGGSRSRNAAQPSAPPAEPSATTKAKTTATAGAASAKSAAISGFGAAKNAAAGLKNKSSGSSGGSSGGSGAAASNSAARGNTSTVPAGYQQASYA